MPEYEEDQIELFGAPRGEITEFVLTVSPPDATQRGSVRMTAFCVMRKAPMHLRITSLASDQMALAVGYVVPLALKAHYVNGDRFKAHVWQVYRRLGIAGWEVEIRGCGKG